MVLRLADAMEVPLRERNVLLRAAGFAPVYAETALDAPTMTPVRNALEGVLAHHEPLPALVVDRLWNVVMSNEAAARTLALGGDMAALLERVGAEEGELNIALLTLHPRGLRPAIRNWAQIAPSFVRRLRAQAMASGDPLVVARFEAYAALAGPLEEGGVADPGLLPVLPLELGFGDLTLRLFSVFSTFGTPQDVTTDELRVEAFYPADEATTKFFAEAAHGAQLR